MAWKKTGGPVAFQREVIEIDADGKVVGRLASEVARLLMGKHQPGYTPHIDTGAIVKIKNVQKIALTGRKEEQKVHFHSSNRPGGIRRATMPMLRANNPGEILRHAVKYMLSKNSTQKERLKRLLFV